MAVWVFCLGERSFGSLRSLRMTGIFLVQDDNFAVILRNAGDEESFYFRL